MKYILRALFSFLFISPLLAQEIKILTWEYFLSEEVVDAFTKKTGHTVKIYFYDSEVDRNAILVNGQGEKYDLVLVDNATTLLYGKAGILRPLDSLHIDNLQYIGQQWQESCGQYGIPYAKGTMGIVHRTSVSKNKIDSWNDILPPPKEHIGTTMMIKDDVDTVAIALLAQGFDPFTRDENELKSAYSLLVAQSKYLLNYGYPISYTSEQGKDSKLTLAVIYSGDLYNIKKSTGQNDWEYVVPKEGTLFFVDCFTSPSGGALKDGTRAFLGFINDPAIAYKNASDVWFSTTNEAAQLMASDKYKNDSEISPDVETLKRSHRYQPLSSDDLVIRNRIVSILNINE
ncbi:MAG: spermidine/putrescine transport system substrate-binding protein [Psychromonas sp.]|jgi:spermidine/putrescine transport system substrate-binding protein|uniref:polyamine ABC transporter substrate-binding protein n=1 Tax=Psychromonas sp. TaxID=1884585 RepID=UPI0039E3D93D